MFKSACGKIFNLEVIKKGNIRFDVELSHYEDSLFVSEYCKVVEES